jgi:hypothetical protein
VILAGRRGGFKTSATGTKVPDPRYQGMQQKSDKASRVRAEALFRRREQQKADAPIAMAEYRAKQQAALQRMHELRRQRLAREAQEMAGKR